MLKGVRKQWATLAAVAVGVSLAVYWNGSQPAGSPPVVSTPAPGLPDLRAEGRNEAAGPWGSENCAEARFVSAASRNARSLGSLSFAPFHRSEHGWETYAPLIGAEVGTRCAPTTPGFASAIARWQKDRGLTPTGQVDPDTFQFMKGVWQGQRPFVKRTGGCPPPPPASQLEGGRPGEGYGGKYVELTHGAFAAYRRMVRDARAADPAIRADPRYLQIFSAYRSPEYDAARCARQKNCNGIVRARCSPHRTGRAMDLYVGQAPGYGPDSSADPNRLVMTHSPAYRWLVANAYKYGFVPYAFEPWHWEWIGEPGSSTQG
ncbi:MAG TPA: M15 family metallopeptidase [Caulobacteraceae bacterium]